MNETRRAVVVGAGFGGLAAAAGLAARGWQVDVLEAAPQAGGKAGSVVLDAVEVDTGPSVLTLPDAFAAVFARAGMRLEDEVVLRTPTPAFRYLYPDGLTLDIHPELDATLASVHAALGRGAADDLARFLARARRTWDAAAPHFILAPPPSLGSLLRPGALAALPHLDAFRTMRGAIDGNVRDPHLRHLLWRYATYNGSDVRRAPATLNCIAHVELGLGGFGVEGGIRALVDACVRACERVGVQFHYQRPARRILLSTDGRVTGVDTDAGHLPARVVVANADASAVRTHLLPSGTRHGLSAPREASTSGWTGILRARRRDEAPRVAHTVVFPENYLAEFEDLFDRDRPPADPTVYLCAQEACHGRPGWPDAEPVFVMANAPAHHAGDCAELRARVETRLDAAGLRAPEDAWIWERTPAGLAAEHPGSGGALYGAASNDAFAAFRRPPNRVTGVPGLYLASGSAHPGGGMPLCARSGLAAADAALADHGGPA